jgi:hypothetical protein
VFCTPILMHASTLLILRKSRMRRRARTDLGGGRSAMVVPTATVETDGHGGAKMILPGETEAGSAGTQPCRGIAWWSYRCLENPRPQAGILTNGERPLSISG